AGVGGVEWGCGIGRGNAGIGRAGQSLRCSRFTQPHSTAWLLFTTGLSSAASIWRVAVQLKKMSSASTQSLSLASSNSVGRHACNFLPLQAERYVVHDFNTDRA